MDGIARLRHAGRVNGGLQKYQLAEIYARLRRAAGQGDVRESVALLRQALPVALPEPGPGAIAAALTDGLVPALTYRGWKPAELAMLADDVKPVLKFEDIPLADARKFEARYAAQYQILVTEPFVKDYLLLRTRPGQPDPREALVTLYVSRGDQARQLRDLELADPYAAEASGALLGFPPCCTAAFARVFGASRADQDTVNDDATRAVLDAATTATPGHAWLNPLSDMEPIGCYACSPRCPEALALAGRSVAALTHRRPDLVQSARAALTAPTLLWRLPFFLTFTGASHGDGLAYTAVHANAFPDPAVRRVQAVFAATLLPLLRQGDWLQVHDTHLEVRKGQIRVGELAWSGPPPALSAWTWPDPA